MLCDALVQASTLGMSERGGSVVRRRALLALLGLLEACSGSHLAEGST